MGSKTKGRGEKGASDGTKPEGAPAKGRAQSRRNFKQTRKEQKAASRATLKECAIDCFARHGYEETSVADITHAAGLSHTSFYFHFESKEALFGEILADANQHLMETVGPVLLRARDLSLRDLIHELADRVLSVYERHRTIVKVCTVGPSPAVKIVGSAEGLSPAVRDYIAAAIERYMGRVDLTDDGLSMVAYGLMFMWLRISIYYLYKTEHAPSQALRDEAVALMGGAAERVIEGLRATKPSAAAPGGSRKKRS